jgi:hypothetical protein
MEERTMTFRNVMVKAMTSRGMFLSQAEEVISKYIESNEGNPMMDRWHEDVIGYPEALQNILWMGVKEYAANWIANNAPEAWFRPMFEYSEAELTQMMQNR